MPNLLDPQFYQDAGKLILAIIGFISLAKRLTTSIHSSIPKKVWQHTWMASRTTAQWFAKELTLPKRYPFAETLAEVMLTAIFYILTLYCFFLFLMDVSLIFFGNAVAWKCLAAFAVAIVIMVMARWCFKQAEVSRIKLSATSRVLW